MDSYAIPLWAIYAAAVPLTVWLFVAIALPRRDAARVLAHGVAQGASTPRGRRLVAVFLVVLIFNSLQSRLDPAVTDALGYELTGWVHSLEGDWVERIQAPVARSWTAAALLTWVYVCGYVSILLAPLFVWSALDRWEAATEHSVGFALNYALALPFYLFFPVREAAWSGLTGAEPLMESVIEGVSAQMRTESALDNCFPSLHVSCTLTAAWFCHRHGPARLRALGWTVAALTAYAVMALGVHWGLDVLAALPFGLGCAALATRLTRAHHHVAGEAVADQVQVGTSRPRRAQATWSGRRTR